MNIHFFGFNQVHEIILYFMKAERMVWLSQFHRLVWHESLPRKPLSGIKIVCMFDFDWSIDLIGRDDSRFFLEARFVLVLEGRNIFQITIQPLLAILSFHIDVLLCTKVMSKEPSLWQRHKCHYTHVFQRNERYSFFQRFLVAIWPDASQGPLNHDGTFL